MLRGGGLVAPALHNTERKSLGELMKELQGRDQSDIDSMDFLNFVIGLHKELKVEIPEADYPKLASLNSGVEYLLAVYNARRQE